MSIFDIDAQIHRYIFDTAILIHGPNVELVYTQGPEYHNMITSSEIDYLYDDLVPNQFWDTIDVIEERNGTSLIQSFQISRLEETTSSFTWSIESGFTFSVSVGASVKVPFVGGIETTIETSLNLSTTASQTEEKTRTWQFVKTVNVPPQTRVTAHIMLEKTKPRIPFIFRKFFQGYFSFKADVYVNGVSRGYMTVKEMPLWNAFNNYNIPNFSIQNGVVVFETNGVFQANDGLKGLIDLNEYPLNIPMESDEYYSKHWVFHGVLKDGSHQTPVMTERMQYTPIGQKSQSE